MTADFRIQDVMQATGLTTSQYKDAVTLAKTFEKGLKGNEQTIVGHSLGGGLSAIGALSTQIPAITFNPAAIHANTKKELNISNKSANQILNIIVDGEIVNDIQKKLHLKLDGINKIIYDSENTNKWNLKAPIKKHLIDSVIKILKKNKYEIQ